jgi:drug/metabolite transporter (DMT)-like permease
MLIFYYGLKHTPARVATICELAWPGSSLLIGIIVFKNTFTLTQVVGIILLISAMLLISLTQKEKNGVVAERKL